MSETSTSWFTDARLGLFVHWGLYSLPARHEWVMSHEKTTLADYELYARYFDPDLFDPAAWARSAKAAGMKYAVLTTKHHDGFCLWDSALTSYTSMNTPHGSDIVRAYVDAFREAGLKIGFYHSLIDWHHPDFPIDGIHPRRDDPDREQQNEGRAMQRYREYLHGQVRELLTGYGTIDYLFFDFSYREPDPHLGLVWNGKGAAEWGADDLRALARDLQPGILINDRLDIEGDFVTPEQYQPTAPMQVDGHPVVWEACQTLNGSWGYDRDNDNYKSVELLIAMLIDGVSNDGNLLLNVGPTARGLLDPHAEEALAGVGDWMTLHSRSIHGAGASGFEPPRDCRYTQRGTRLYLHVLSWPFEFIHLPGLADRVEYAQLLHDASEVRPVPIDPDAAAGTTGIGAQPPGTLTLRLPIRRPDVAVPVIELFLRD